MKKVTVYADFDFLESPQEIGTLGYERVRGKDHFIFEYSHEWLKMHGGIGLRYTASMLRQFYGEDCTLLLENKPEGGARATIHLSMWKEASHDTGTDY